eukprot:5288307-Pyramimonas_sp.AAC.1
MLAWACGSGAALHLRATASDASLLCSAKIEDRNLWLDPSLWTRSPAASMASPPPSRRGTRRRSVRPSVSLLSSTAPPGGTTPVCCVKSISAASSIRALPAISSAACLGPSLAVPCS